jgi:hypothetical protein
MKDLKELFVPYEIAVKLKEKGFKVDCFGYYWHDSNNELRASKPILAVNWNDNDEYNKDTSAPLWQQVIDWLREEKEINFEVHYFGGFGSDNYEFKIITKEGKAIWVGNKNKSYHSSRQQAIEKALELI